jgi:hypothetical protein
MANVIRGAGYFIDSEQTFFLAKIPNDALIE